MITKADKTKEYILKTVAPIFNRNGYVGTTMSEITAATKLTKGAIYGNFKDKEELARKAFEFNIKNVINQIEAKMAEADSPIEQLRKIFEFYREYYIKAIEAGGCPVLNIGVDANHRSPTLFARVQEIIKRIEKDIMALLAEAIVVGQVKKGTDVEATTKNIFSVIQGSVFLSLTMNDPSYLTNATNRLDDYVDELSV